MKTLKQIIAEGKKPTSELPDEQKRREEYHAGYSALHAHAKKLNLHPDVIGQMEQFAKTHAKPRKVYNKPGDWKGADPGRDRKSSIHGEER